MEAGRLGTASALFDDLQAETGARAAVVEALAAKAQDAERRAEYAIRCADLREEEAKAVGAFLDRALMARLAYLERKARRREWILATMGRF